MFSEGLKALGTKTLSLLLMLNSLFSLVSSLSIACGVLPGCLLGNLHKPYILNILFLSFITLTAILNIIPAKFMGRVNIRRLLFHHYVYGFLSILFYLALIFSLLLVETATCNAYLMTVENRIYLEIPLYWGITLILDDLPDLSPKIGRLLNNLKVKVSELNNVIVWVHRSSSVISACAALWYISRLPITGNNFIHLSLTISFIITALCGLKTSSGGIWLKYLSDAQSTP